MFSRLLPMQQTAQRALVKCLGVVLAQAAFAAKVGFLEAGQAIINGPVDAINALIELSNQFLGTDFLNSRLTLTGRMK